MVYPSRPYHFKFLKGCLPLVLPGPFLNTLTNIHNKKENNVSNTRGEDLQIDHKSFILVVFYKGIGRQ